MPYRVMGVGHKIYADAHKSLKRGVALAGGEFISDDFHENMLHSDEIPAEGIGKVRGWIAKDDCEPIAQFTIPATNTAGAEVVFHEGKKYRLVITVDQIEEIG